MKTLTLFAALLMPLLSYGQGNARTMEFWDGTFAYNKLVVKEHQFQGNILTLELSGSTIGLGAQVEALPKTWGTQDKIIVSVRKDNCKFDFIKKNIACDIHKASGSITWSINNRVSKSLNTVFENIKVEASSPSDFTTMVKMDLIIPSDRYFTPANEDISVNFADLDFNF